MAHNAIPLSSVQLVDNWPGPVNFNAGIPTNGWDNTVDNFETSDATHLVQNPPQMIGEKRAAYTDNSHCPGWYTMMYLCYHSFENACVSADMSDSLQLCTHYDGSDCEWYDNSHSPYFVVTNEITKGITDATKGMRIAFPCASLASDGTDAYASGQGDSWGWFWVGGVCPCKEATILDGTAGNGLGVEFECASTFTGGPMTLDDFSTDGTTGYIIFKEAISDATVAFAGIRNAPIVAYGDLSGS